MEETTNLKELVNQASNLRMDGKIPEALEILQKLRETREQYSGDKTLISVYTLSSLCFLRQNQKTESMESALKGYELACEMDHPRGKALSLFSIGSCHLSMRQFKLAEETALEMLRISQDIQDDKMIVDAINLAAGAYYHQGDRLKALEYWLRFIEKVKKQKPTWMNFHRLASVMSNLLGLYSDFGDLEKALEYGFQSYKICKEQNSVYSLVGLTNNLGLLFFKLHDHVQSLRYYRETLSLCRKLDTPDIRAKVYDNIGLLYKNAKRPIRALQYFHRSLDLKISQNDKMLLPTLYQNMALLYEENFEQFDNALELYGLALETASEMESDDQRANISLYYGVCLTKQKQFDKAFPCIMQALEYFRKDGNLHREMETILALSKYWEACGDYKKAYEVFSEWHDLSKRQFDADKARSIALLQVQHNMEQKEREAQLAKKDAEIYRLKTEELEKRVQEEVMRHQQQQQIIVQKSKLESLGQLAAGIAHEVNQPLTRIMMGLDNVLFTHRRGKLDDDFVVMKTNQFLKESERIRLIIDHIKTFSRDDQLTTYDMVDLNEVIEKSLLLFNEQYRKHGVELQLDLQPGLPTIIGHPFKLEQVLLNLITNARDAVDEQMTLTGNPDYHKRIIIRTHNDLNKVVLRVEDNGTGIKPEYIDKIFEPFFTRKKDGKGTGLGLPVCYGIVKDFDGDIEVESQPGINTIMTVSFPAVSLAKQGL